MPTPRSTVGLSQDLAVAPAGIRCMHVIERSDGSGERCSRFSIKLPDGSRDDHCISHSKTQYASLLRSKGSKAKKAAAEADRERRKKFAESLYRRRWRSRKEVLTARFRLSRAVASGEVSAAQGRLLRQLLNDADEYLRLHQYG